MKKDVPKTQSILTKDSEYDVVTIGSATIDIFADSDNELITIKSRNGTEELLAYPLGSKILIKKIDFQVGGGGTNTAVSFSRLGFRTAYIGCVGNDARGAQVVELLKKEGVDFIGHFENAQTNLSVILDSIENDRTILVYKDASDKLKASKLKLKTLKTKMVYSSSIKDTGYKTVIKIAIWCRKNAIPFAFNPSNYQASKGAEYLRPLLKNTTILILNDEEASLLVGKGSDDYLLFSLRKLGPKIVALTKGKQGAACLYNGSVYSTMPRNVKIKETTGAGDAFASGFVSGIMLKDDPIYSLRMGMIQAEAVIQYYGAKNILLHKDKMLRMIASDKRVILNHHVHK